MSTRDRHRTSALQLIGIALVTILGTTQTEAGQFATRKRNTGILYRAADVIAAQLDDYRIMRYRKVKISRTGDTVCGEVSLPTTPEVWRGFIVDLTRHHPSFDYADAGLQHPDLIEHGRLASALRCGDGHSGDLTMPFLLGF